jgi:hypothetical protein
MKIGNKCCATLAIVAACSSIKAAEDSAAHARNQLLQTRQHECRSALTTLEVLLDWSGNIHPLGAEELNSYVYWMDAWYHTNGRRVTELSEEECDGAITSAKTLQLKLVEDIARAIAAGSGGGDEARSSYLMAAYVYACKIQGNCTSYYIPNVEIELQRSIMSTIREVKYRSDGAVYGIGHDEAYLLDVVNWLAHTESGVSAKDLAAETWGRI